LSVSKNTAKEKVPVVLSTGKLYITLSLEQHLYFANRNFSGSTVIKWEDLILNGAGQSILVALRDQNPSSVSPPLQIQVQIILTKARLPSLKLAPEC
jgi:hypothetical protein